jgi:hypothetical protein
VGRKISDAAEMFRLAHWVLDMQVAYEGMQLANVCTQPASLHFQLAHEKHKMAEGESQHAVFSLPARRV